MSLNDAAFVAVVVAVEKMAQIWVIPTGKTHVELYQRCTRVNENNWRPVLVNKRFCFLPGLSLFPS